MLRNRLLLACIRCIVMFVYRRADRINVITEGYRENLIAMGVPAHKISRIHHWVPDGSFDPVAYDVELASAEGLHNRFNVMYAGAMGPHQDLETAIDAALLLRDLPQVQFVLAGDGVEHASLVRSARIKGVTNVRFLGRRPPEEMQKLYAMADALLIHLRPDPMSRVSIPSKTFAYMASGRPILMGVEGEASRLVDRHACGIAITPSDPKALAAAVRTLYEMPSDRRRAMGNASVVAYQQEYCSAVQIQKFAAMLQAVACGSPWPAIHDNVVRKAA
jgi:glycosyltransferase involved in cell wall biosynthesis